MTETSKLRKQLAFYEQFTGYLEDGHPADAPALECTKCGAFYLIDLGSKSLCADCLEALEAENLKLEARIAKAMAIGLYQGGDKWTWNEARDEFRAALQTHADSEGGGYE